MTLPYINLVNSNAFIFFTGVGTGGLNTLFGLAHLEGLFITTLAENGVFVLCYLVFIIILIFNPLLNMRQPKSPQSIFLCLSFIPFLSVSIYSSLTIYSSLIYPILFSLSFSQSNALAILNRSHFLTLSSSSIPCD
jgi:hypothetical protein